MATYTHLSVIYLRTERQSALSEQSRLCECEGFISEFRLGVKLKLESPYSREKNRSALCLLCQEILSLMQEVNICATLNKENAAFRIRNRCRLATTLFFH